MGIGRWGEGQCHTQWCSGLREPSRVLGIKPGSDTCKASTLPTSLALQSCLIYFLSCEPFSCLCLTDYSDPIRNDTLKGSAMVTNQYPRLVFWVKVLFCNINTVHRNELCGINLNLFIGETGFLQFRIHEKLVEISLEFEGVSFLIACILILTQKETEASQVSRVIPVKDRVNLTSNIALQKMSKARALHFSSSESHR